LLTSVGVIALGVRVPLPPQGERKMKHEYVECKCGTVEHVLRFTWDPDPDWDEICVDVHLQYHYGFFKRLWYGIKYILGFKSRYGQFDEAILSYEEVEKLRDICNKWLETHQKKPSTLEEKLMTARLVEKMYERKLEEARQKREEAWLRLRGSDEDG